MDESKSLIRSWIRVGLAAGVLALADYMLLLLLPGPKLLVLLLAAAFGPLLATGVAGLYHLLALDRRSVALQAGAVAVATGGVVFTLMALVQLAVRAAAATAADSIQPAQAELVRRGLNGVQLGLDVAWDLFLGLGCVLLAWSLRRHPRYGWIYTVSGILIGLAVLALNFATFPVPPANAGLVDVGPLAGLWLLAVTARALLSLDWADERLVDGAAAGATP